MVRHHVSQRARHVKVASAFFNAHGLRNGDLHMIDVTTIPYGFEDTVAEAEDQDVLNGLFSEVVVNAEDLPLFEHFAYQAVQLLGGVEIIAERFLKDNAPPMAIFFLCQTGRAKLFHDVAKEHRAGGEIEEVIALDSD